MILAYWDFWLRPFYASNYEIEKRVWSSGCEGRSEEAKRVQEEQEGNGDDLDEGALDIAAKVGYVLTPS